MRRGRTRPEARRQPPARVRACPCGAARATPPSATHLRAPTAVAPPRGTWLRWSPLRRPVEVEGHGQGAAAPPGQLLALLVLGEEEAAGPGVLVGVGGGVEHAGGGRQLLLAD